jgi:DivIVA domain-containing protein
LALERDSIEKKDFPVGRRGYDPAAVDAHLSTIADEVEALKRGGERAAQPMATAVSEQVRGIIEAAERGAAEIQARAGLEARQIREEALHVAERERQEATEGARHEREQAAQHGRAHVGRLSAATSKMLERLQTIDGDLNSLTASLHAGAERLKGELERLEEELGGLSAATSARADSGVEAPAADHADATVATAGAAEREPGEVADSAAGTASPTAAAAPSSAAAGAVGDRPPETGGQPEPDVAVPEPVAATPERVAASEPEPGGEPTKRDDSEGARLIALNMALNGTPREETERYLAENFSLHNREMLLDEVYASVHG